MDDLEQAAAAQAHTFPNDLEKAPASEDGRYISTSPKSC
jgi:hypothetical protein